ncbi:unnamed protein product [Oppiella nova]|uniref:Uncharacterized protein n=1 Tax=Oppiella nova TaxID=334625 RepID=A0A7R9LEL1_9ACAR|nr:unnamed protein product [Oppiella nova]CAG2162876.1 unnamed protein product [Oppiella nova]
MQAIILMHPHASHAKHFSGEMRSRHSERPDHVIKHIPEMTFISLISGMGGLTGMWLGNRWYLTNIWFSWRGVSREWRVCDPSRLMNLVMLIHPHRYAALHDQFPWFFLTVVSRKILVICAIIIHPIVTFNIQIEFVILCNVYGKQLDMSTFIYLYHMFITLVVNIRNKVMTMDEMP